MRVVKRTGVVCALLLALGAWHGDTTVGAQSGVDPALRQRVERRFEVLPVRGGVVLTPRHNDDVKSIEIRDGVIAIDGDAATGADLRKRLGADAEVVLQMSYLPADVLVHWRDNGTMSKPADTAGPPSPPSPPQVTPPPPPSDDSANDDDDYSAQKAARDHDQAAESSDSRHWRKSSTRVHVGGDVSVAEDEEVTDPVVAIFGTVTLLGRADDDVVAVLGNVHLGPKAVVRGDVTSVGGHVEQEPGATIHGKVTEVGLGAPHFAPHPLMALGALGGLDMMHGSFRLVGTLLRIGVVLVLAFLVALLGQRPVERIGDRAARDPWLSGFTGLLAQLLFVPVVVIVVVVLAISIIGIPLLVLVPFAILAFLLAIVVGFTGVALRVGRWAAGDHRSIFLSLTVGVVLAASVSVLARTIGLLPGPLWAITWPLGVLGFFLEYLVWTVGLGAALLTRFGSRGLPYGPYGSSGLAVPPPLPMYQEPPSGL